MMPLKGALAPLFVASRSVFSPTNIAGLRLWFDFADTSTLFQDDARTTLVASDGDVIGGVTDKSGNAKHAYQATTSLKPLYKVGVQNGRSAVRFDSVDDLLNVPNSLVGATDFTAFIVVNRIAPNAYSAPLGSVSFYVNIDMPIGTNDGYIGVGDLPSRIVITSPAYFANGAWIYTFAKSGSSSGNLSFWKNGGDIRQNTGLTAPPPGASDHLIGRYTGGLGMTWNGYVCEIIIYGSALSTSNRALVETYLNAKWGVY